MLSKFHLLGTHPVITDAPAWYAEPEPLSKLRFTKLFCGGRKDFLRPAFVVSDNNGCGACFFMNQSGSQDKLSQSQLCCRYITPQYSDLLVTSCFYSGALPGVRTLKFLVLNQLPMPVRLAARFILVRPVGFEPTIAGLKVRCRKPFGYERFYKLWGEQPDLNRYLPESQSGALPLSYAHHKLVWVEG